MAHNVNSRATSPADILRDALDEAEKWTAAVAPDNLESLLLSLDRIDAELERLADSGLDLRAEQGRWEGLIHKVNKQAPAFAKAGARQPGYANLRRRHAIGPETEVSFWWYLDQEAVRRRRRMALRMTSGLGSILGLILLAYWTMQTFFPPDPRDLLYADVMYRLDQFAMEQQWPDALALVQANQTELADEPDLYLWQGALAEILGEPELAAESLAQAQALLADKEVAFWNNLGNRRIQVGNLDGAEAALERALTLDPQNPQSYFLLGGLAEVRNDYPQAIDYYTITFELAQANEPQLAVIARVRVGQLLQMPGILSIETPEEP